MNCYICGTGINVCDKCKDYYIPDYSNSLSQIAIELAVPKIIALEKEKSKEEVKKHDEVIEIECPKCKNCVSGLGVNGTYSYSVCANCGNFPDYNIKSFIINKIYKIWSYKFNKPFYHRYVGQDKGYWVKEEVSNHE